MRQSAKKSPLFQLFTKKYFIIKHLPLITFEGLREFLEDYLFDDFESEFINKFDLNWRKTIKFLVISIFCDDHDQSNWLINNFSFLVFQRNAQISLKRQILYGKVGFLIFYKFKFELNRLEKW